MGAWGYEPFENDSALNWIEDTSAYKGLEKDLRRTLSKPLKSGFAGKMRAGPDEVRAAASLLVSGYKAGLLDKASAREIANMAIDRLREILNMDEWIDGWESPGTVRRGIQNQIRNIETSVPHIESVVKRTGQEIK